MMPIEYEATFTNINKDEIRNKLKKIGAQLAKPESLFTRYVFNLPGGQENKDAWLRVRNEGDKITLSLKIVDGNKIKDQKEICLTVDNIDSAVNFLKTIGCQQKSYQETKREIWYYKDVEICIDEWPYLEPFVEVESDSEGKVKRVSELLGFDYNEALFCSATTLYKNKYNLPAEYIDQKIPRITFTEENPFLKLN